MNDNTPDKILMRLKLPHFVHSIVIKHSNLGVI